jgi:hypothetical protein
VNELEGAGCRHVPSMALAVNVTLMIALRLKDYATI